MNIRDFNLKKSITTVLIVMTVLQIAVLSYFNIFTLDKHLGFDGSTFFMTAYEMWNQKSLVLSEWGYQTSLDIDCSAPLAAVLYGIIHNIFIAYGLANIIIMLLTLVTMYKLLKKLGCSVDARLAAMNLFMVMHLIPYDRHNCLRYGAMLFVDCAAYNVRIFLALTIVLVFLMLLERTYRNDEGESVKSRRLVYWYSCFTVGLSLFSGISNGFMLLVLVVIPVLLWYTLKLLKERALNQIMESPAGLFIFLETIAFFAGKLIAEKVIHFESKESMLNLLKADRFWTNLGSIYQGFLVMLNAIPNEDVPLFSIGSLTYLINTFYVAGFFIGLYFYLKKDKSEKSAAEGLILTILFVDLCVFAMANLTYGEQFFETRYLIVPYVLSLYFTALFYSRVKQNYSETMFPLIMLVMLFFIQFTSNKVYLNTTMEHEKYKEIAAAVGEHPQPVVFVVGNAAANDVLPDNLSRCLRLYDLSKTYKYVHTELWLELWGDTDKYSELSDYSGEVLMLTNNQVFEQLPSYIKDEIIDDEAVELNMHLYTLKKNVFDFKAGIDGKHDLYIETPYTGGVGRQDHGEITNDKLFENTLDESDFMILGPYAPAEPGVYDFTLHYELEKEDEETFFDVYSTDNEEVLGKVLLKKDQKSITISGVEIKEHLDRIEYRVRISGHNSILIDSIEIRPVE